MNDQCFNGIYKVFPHKLLPIQANISKILFNLINFKWLIQPESDNLN